MNPHEIAVIIPCRNEAGSIGDVVARIPAGMQGIVVDNGSDDGTADRAREAGAIVVYESEPGYGSAVTAGVTAADRDVVCTIDGDGSMDPVDLLDLVAELDRGADLAVGRRRPDSPRTWPLHARAGSAAVAAYLRRRYHLPIHDIGPMRAIRRETLLSLGVADRQSGYPVELLLRAGQAGLRVTERDVRYTVRTAGQSKVSGSVRGSVRAARDFVMVLR
ncbi:glycosyltransferase family 2 protein [Gordonia sp. PKS22-38]|uniref:Glycosyltransferase family 2 protein n=1 Tax=Gordonia prachuapensis TaxID=3115651 RepID=A0ABU7MUS5_9ACTN|nr:glycosyltransferase family 2 protein [Gordonia sp. PKS22-38]